MRERNEREIGIRAAPTKRAAKEKPRPGTSVFVKKRQAEPRNILIHWITSESNKERHHLSENTAKDIDNKLDKLPKGLNKGHSNEDCKERNHS